MLVIHLSVMLSMRAETTLDSVQAVGLTGIGNNLDTLFPKLLCGIGKTKQNALGWVQLWLTEPGKSLAVEMWASQKTKVRIHSSKCLRIEVKAQHLDSVKCQCL